jgi:hypothetical protein
VKAPSFPVTRSIMGFGLTPRLWLPALEFDLALAEIGFYARQRAEKIIIPERAAELSVGDGTKTDLFLLSDDGGDFAVLGCFQFG